MSTNAIRVDYRPGQDAAQGLRQLEQQLGDGAAAILLTDIALVSGANSIPHGRDSVPRACVPTVRGSSATAYETQAPDTTFVYVTASADCTASLVIYP